MSASLPATGARAFCTAHDTAAPLSQQRFASPWAARLFGLTIALSETGAFSLADFQAALTAAIHEHEADAPIEDEAAYYGCWLQALCALTAEAGLLDEAALTHSERAVTERLIALRHEHTHKPRRIAPLVVA
ncbi:MAG: nitrile hydratase accessory protein [Pseudomonadota bacterium]